MSTEVKRHITLTQEGDVWVAKDEDVNVASHGKTREEALENLDEGVALHEGGGEPVTDEDLREWGIDPDDVPDEEQEPDAPWFDRNR